MRVEPVTKDAPGFARHLKIISYLVSRGFHEGGLTVCSKNFKTPFLRDIDKSYQKVTPEPHNFFF